ncbi:hypothetical protein J4Q44_G00238610 [Coregonus suidteri]|uniref:Uncharacterized protein n=1 Tax=Coregonus suidteri TaxID=861788 RepID=A0AAN8LK28_9TELE
MRMDKRTRRGSAAHRRVPEERSAALQDVSRMGANNAGQEAIHAREIFTSYFFEEGEGGVQVCFDAREGANPQSRHHHLTRS